jgi:hypothetical protein
MAFSFTTVTEQYGAGATGTVRFVLDRQMSNGGDAAGSGAAWVATLDGSGNISQQLPSTMDAGTRTSTGTADARMRVHEVIAGRADRVYYVQIPTSGPVDLGSLTKYDDTGGAATANFLTPGSYMFPASQHSTSTSAALGNGTLRLLPWIVSQRIVIDRVGADVGTVGEAGSKFRLGIYADTGFILPGALLLDAGQIAGDSATVQDAPAVSLALPPGLYWIGGAVQSAPTTQPTMRTVNQWAPPVPISSSVIPTAGQILLGYSMTGVTGALPASFTGSTATTFAARPHVRTA